ncbi:MAG: hypothetical protein V1743_02405 [Nanoarchaeota archaeon]
MDFCICQCILGGCWTTEKSTYCFVVVIFSLLFVLSRANPAHALPGVQRESEPNQAKIIAEQEPADLPTTTTIYDIQQRLVSQGTPVEVSAVVTSPVHYDDQYLLYYFFIQEEMGGPYSGIKVMSYFAPPVREGDRVTFWATYEEMPMPEGESVLRAFPDPFMFQVLAHGTKLTPYLFSSIQSFMTYQEPWEGVLVKFATNLVVINIQPGLFYVQDPSYPVPGLLVRGNMFTYQPLMNQAFQSISGPIGQSFEGYDIEPRYPADLVTNDLQLNSAVFLRNPVQPGEDAIIMFSITNFNSASYTNVRYRIQPIMSQQSTWFNYPIPFIQAQSTIGVNARFNYGLLGNYDGKIELDPFSYINESNEANNVQQFRWTVETIALEDIPSEFVTCGTACGSTFCSDGPHYIPFVQNMPNVSQFTNGTANDHLGNVSCGPASGASVIQKLNQTFPGITNMSTNQLIETLRNLTVTRNNSGTSTNNLVLALIELLRNTSYLNNISIRWYTNTSLTNTSRTISYKGKNFTMVKTNPSPDINNLITEFITNNEYVILSTRSETYGYNHYMVLEDLSQHPNADGSYNISFMDPWGDGENTGTAGTAYGTKDGTAHDGHFHMQGETFIILSMITISPE